MAKKLFFEALGDDLLKLMPLAAPGLNRFDLKTFTKDSSRSQHRGALSRIIHKEMRVVMERLKTLGPEENAWRWGDLHQIAFGTDKKTSFDI